jgi:beta-carotene 3-hydroxylase
MNWLINIAAVIAAFAIMEFVAWFTHKYVMHGFLWSLHKDHHDGGYHPFQKNDAFFLIFATPCCISLIVGMLYEQYWLVGFAIGIFLYGLCYFLVHDVIIHQRFKWFSRSNNRYIRVLRWAHKMHHKHRTKYNGESFGLLIVAGKYWQKVKDDDARAMQSVQLKTNE